MHAVLSKTAVAENVEAFIFDSLLTFMPVVADKKRTDEPRADERTKAKKYRARYSVDDDIAEQLAAFKLDYDNWQAEEDEKDEEEERIAAEQAREEAMIRAELKRREAYRNYEAEAAAEYEASRDRRLPISSADQTSEARDLRRPNHFASM